MRPILLSFFIFSMVFIAPMRADAQIGEVVSYASQITGGCLAQVGLTTAASAVNYLDFLSVPTGDIESTFGKECILDGAAKAFAAALLDRFVNDVVEWAQSGFAGKPLFLDNPDRFLEDSLTGAIDQIIRGGGPLGNLLNALCTGLDFDVRFSIARRFGGYNPTCTISEIGDRWDNFVKGDIESLKDFEDLIIFGNADTIYTPWITEQNLIEHLGATYERIGGAIDGNTISYYDPNCLQEIKGRSDYLTRVDNGEGENADAVLLDIASEICSVETTAEGVEDALNQTKEVKIDEVGNVDEFQDIFSVLIEAALRGGLVFFKESVLDGNNNGGGGSGGGDTRPANYRDVLEDKQSETRESIIRTSREVSDNLFVRKVLSEDRSRMYTTLIVLTQSSKYKTFLTSCNLQNSNYSDVVESLLESGAIDASLRFTFEDGISTEEKERRINNKKEDLIDNPNKTIEDERDSRNEIIFKIERDIEKINSLRDIALVDINSVDLDERSAESELNSVLREFENEINSINPAILRSSTINKEIQENEDLYILTVGLFNKTKRGASGNRSRSCYTRSQEIITYVNAVNKSLNNNFGIDNEFIRDYRGSLLNRVRSYL